MSLYITLNTLFRMLRLVNYFVDAVAEDKVAGIVVLFELMVYSHQKSEHTGHSDRNFVPYKAAAVRLPVLLGGPDKRYLLHEVVARVRMDKVAGQCRPYVNRKVVTCSVMNKVEVEYHSVGVQGRPYLNRKLVTYPAM